MPVTTTVICSQIYRTILNLRVRMTSEHSRLADLLAKADEGKSISDAEQSELDQLQVKQER